MYYFRAKELQGHINIQKQNVYFAEQGIKKKMPRYFRAFGYNTAG